MYAITQTNEGAFGFVQGMLNKSEISQLRSRVAVPRPEPRRLQDVVYYETRRELSKHTLWGCKHDRKLRRELCRVAQPF